MEIGAGRTEPLSLLTFYDWIKYDTVRDCSFVSWGRCGGLIIITIHS